MKFIFRGLVAVFLCFVAILIWLGFSPNPQKSQLLAPLMRLFSAPQNSNKELFEKVRQTNLKTGIKPNALSSYRSTVCVFPNKSADDVAKDGPCLKSYFGVASPDSAYLSLTAGDMQILQIVNGAKGWQFSTKTKTPPPNLSDAEGDKLQAIKENAKHSLPSLWQILSRENGWQTAPLEVVKDPSALVIRWQDGGSTNDFYFNKETFLCEKQIRRTALGITVLRYFDHTNTGGVMLPHKIELNTEAGQVVATQVIENWELGVVWPDNFFTPEGALKGF